MTVITATPQRKLIFPSCLTEYIGCMYIATLYQTKFFIYNREFGPELWYRTRLVLTAFTYKLHKSVEFGLIFSGPISYYFKLRFALYLYVQFILRAKFGYRLQNQIWSGPW